MEVGACESDREPEGFDDGKLVRKSVGATDGDKVTGASEGAFDGTEVEVTGVSVGVDGGVVAAVGDLEAMILGLEDG